MLISNRASLKTCADYFGSVCIKLGPASQIAGIQLGSAWSGTDFALQVEGMRFRSHVDQAWLIGFHKGCGADQGGIRLGFA